MQDQAAFFDVLGCFLGWIRCGSWGQPYTAQTRSASSAVASRRSGSMTLRLPWSHLGSIGVSPGLLIGREDTIQGAPLAPRLACPVCVGDPGRAGWASGAGA